MTVLSAPEISSSKIYKADISEHPKRVLPQPSELKDIAESSSLAGPSLSADQRSNTRLSFVSDEESVDARGLGTVD